ncbi:hypothetical protein [Actibacterium sp. 188UL27-1]|uniref:CysS/YqeB C-terminal domain-containing protein n=1 Tax=Actibacterium sp. 188UL27-1 TaxID=2786961 RepID=UPI00195C8199|nr:hypothetical protein [Actibacterium sp. 188UL27-1]MBM7067324.1 hypothetical protein [Actibacterium sp. 188UL27-1]
MSNDVKAVLAARIDELLEERRAARERKDFARADAIRGALDGAGIEVQDKEGAPSQWVLKPGFDASKLEGFQ